MVVAIAVAVVVEAAVGVIKPRSSFNAAESRPSRPAGVRRLLNVSRKQSFFIYIGISRMAQGKIKKLITDKGFGFIEGEKGDIFFHHSALVDISIEDLKEGQRVEYEEGRGPKGPRAENVKPV